MVFEIKASDQLSKTRVERHSLALEDGDNCDLTKTLIHGMMRGRRIGGEKVVRL